MKIRLVEANFCRGRFWFSSGTCRLLLAELGDGQVVIMTDTRHEHPCEKNGGLEIYYFAGEWVDRGEKKWQKFLPLGSWDSLAIQNIQVLRDNIPVSQGTIDAIHHRLADKQEWEAAVKELEAIPHPV